MSSEEKIPTEINALRETANRLANLPIENLLRQELGQVGFGFLIGDFKSAQLLCERIGRCSWRGVPTNTVLTIQTQFAPLQGAINAILTFNALTSQNVTQERNVFGANFRQGFQTLYNNAVPHLCFCEIADRDPQESARAIGEALAQVQVAKGSFDAELSNIRQAMTKNKEEMTALVSGLQESAKVGAVTSESIHFKKLADEYRKGAIAWLIASLVAGVGLFLYVKNLQVEPEANEQTIELLARIVPHLVIITLLSTALLFCLRNFASLVHNVIVNRHRQTALTTFQTFVRSTSDQETRNAVLVQATQAIFAPQNSGFLKADSDMPQISQVTEIVRGMAGKDKD